MKKPEPKEYPFNPQTWKKKYKCKKGKGDHKWKVVYARILSQWYIDIFGDSSILVDYECEVCGKKDTRHEK